MAIFQHQEQNPNSILDALYCEEENWEVVDDEEENEEEEMSGNDNYTPLLPILLLEQGLFYDDEELISLFSKEQKQVGVYDISLSTSRKEAIEWMLMVNTHFGFSTLTFILSVNYLDRFLSNFILQDDKPWTMQLVAVTCLSIAAKIEETYVPLLLDLQVEGTTKYMFEAKIIQKMELLVLSTLEWKMHPVTPLSFLDNIIRRLGLKHHPHLEFLKRCERFLISILSDGRFVGCLPSVLATATMMHVIDQIEPSNPLEYQNQLLSVLNISKEKVNDCYQLMKEISSSTSLASNIGNGDGNSKRKWEQMMINASNRSSNNNAGSSPSGVIDHASYYLSCCDSSNDSWAANTVSTTTTTTTSNSNNNNVIALSSSLSLSSSISSSPVRKKGRMMQEQEKLSLSRVFIVDVVGSPP